LLNEHQARIQGRIEKMSKRSIICAGIDTGKHKLDVALHGRPERLQVANTAEGHEELFVWLRQHRVKRVGIEATGGYEQTVVRRLRQGRFVVVVFQPAQVRAYGRFHLRLAKNDKIDAALIAACTSDVRTIHAPPDRRLAELAELQTQIDQVVRAMARFKNHRESCRDAGLRQLWDDEIRRFRGLFRQRLKQLVAAIRQHPDLAERLDLILSVDGIALRTASAIVVRMPEIGQLSRGQAGALAGLVPYDDDSGEHAGDRHIAGGRERLRNNLYAAAWIASLRWNPQLTALYKRLRAAGKEHKVAVVACARKLLIFANAVVARGTPWEVRTIAH
jgi:transposase